MSMTTTFKVKKTGKTLSIITQQYECGLYVAVYTKGQQIPEQSGSTMKQDVFHRKLRGTIKEAGDKFLKDESDALNQEEVMKAKMDFVKQYCAKKGWPLNESPKGYTLSGRRINVLRSRPEWVACEAKLEW